MFLPYYPLLANTTNFDSTRTIFEGLCPEVSNDSVECCVPKSCHVGEGLYGGEDGKSGISGVCMKDNDCDGYNIKSTECSSDGASKCCVPKESNIVCKHWDSVTEELLREGRCIATDACDLTYVRFVFRSS